ncbi:MAG TPA: gamma-glutamyltransferase [Dehalococcoidia bacterium]|nr:gamma-glutamyltransferase [Dehalococcoidia bacterium]
MTATQDVRATQSTTSRVVTRTEARGTGGMVTAKHAAVAEAGLRVLRDGGNAVDAAVAMCFATGVAEPMMSGLGGGGFMTVRLADGREAVVDYQVRAPLAAHETMYELTPDFHADAQGFVGVKDDANYSGPRAAAVPGLASGLAAARDRFGTRPLAALLEPAIALAEEGVEVEWPLTLSLAVNLKLLQRFPASAAIFLDEGRPWAPAAAAPVLLRQPELAATLRRIAAEGPDGFYRGPTARAITAEMERASGHISEADLAQYQAKVIEPLTGSYRGDRIVALPGPASGALQLETLNILEGWQLGALGFNSAETLHLTIEAMRRSHADRLEYLGDPEVRDVPWAVLTGKPYAAVRRTTIDARRHTEATPGDLLTIAGAGAAVAPAGNHGPEAHTTHLSAVDRRGNAVAVTQTLTSAWGCGVAVPGTGVLLNNAMTLFDPRPGTANSIAPRKRPASSMAHAIVVRDGEVVLVAGAPGGRRILDTVTQVLLSVLDHGRGIQDAVSGPFIDSSAAETGIDERVDPAVIAELERRGHRFVLRRADFHPGHFARPAGITRQPHTGELRGGADPYAHGVASGF